MHKNLSGVTFPLLGSLTVSGILIFSHNQVLAQVTPDNTLGDESSVVNTRDATSESIDGGAVRGQNLFHSFQKFNVGEDRGVYFANPDAVTNIFSRVTGNDVSDILGTLGVDGAANLFLINPNGIVFGEGASLDVQGSFTATTADGIEFGEQGFFSTVNPTESVLTISVPLGLQFGSNPGSIVNRSYVEDSTGDFVGLQVPDGENITLVGGEINFEAGEATASGGNIEIGGLSAAGKVTFNDDGSLNFPDNVARADISFSNAADVDVTGTGGGSIKINARNLNVEAGEPGSSQIRAGITADSTSTEAQAGDITIDVADNLSIDESYVTNLVDLEAVGNAGDIDIKTGNLLVKDGGQVNSFTRGQGDAGNITIQAIESVAFDGVDSNNNFSSASSSVLAGAVGDGGNIKITASSLALTNGSYLEASVREASGDFSRGKGQGGNINIDANDTLTISGENARGIFARLDSGAVGNGGNISIQTGNLVVKDGGEITSSTFGQGNAGDITIQATGLVTFDGFDSDSYSSAFSNVDSGAEGDGGEINIKARSLSLTNGGQLEASVSEASDSLQGGKGQGGNINIDVDDTLTIANGNIPGIFANLGVNAVGSAGNVDIQAGNLVVKDGGYISSSTLGKGDSGNISITADNSISLDASSYILNNVEDINAEGDAGKIDITTDLLSVTNGGQINSFTSGQGNAGDITIQATDAVTFDGVDSNDNFSSASSSVLAGGEGNGGNLKITARSLSLTNGSYLEASVREASGDFSRGKGQGGNINIDINDTLTISGENARGIFARLDSGAVGNGGNISIQTGNLVVQDGGQISSSTFGQGNAGNITIQASDAVTFDGFDSDSYSSAFSNVDSGAEGNGGDINITADSLSLINGGQLEASVFGKADTLSGGKGQGGNININADDTLTIAGENTLGIFSRLGVGAEGNAGNVDIQAGNLVIKDGGFITSSTGGRGNAGDITIQATDAVTFDGVDSNENYSGSYSNVNAGGVGDGGNIKITARSLSLTNGGQLTASVSRAFDTLPGGEGQGGNINIDVDDTLTIADGNLPGIFASLGAGAEGNAGNIDIQAGNLLVKDGGQINSFTRGQGDAGNITIQAINAVTFDGVDSNDIFSGSSSSVQAGAIGDGGDINIKARSLSLTNGGELTASVREAFDTLPGGAGQGGNINIDVDDTLTIADGNRPGIFAILGTGAEGSGGDIQIKAKDLVIQNSGEINSSSFGQGNSGNVDITLDNTLEANNGEISTSSTQFSGGAINITAGDMRLRGDSDIRSDIFSGVGGGGNINITADSIIAFDDSDIFAFAKDGRGGDINLDTPAFFAENFTLNSLTSNPDTLDLNSRADVNATGSVSGSVSIPDVNFIQNSLNNLPGNSINTDELVANSCVSPVGNRQQGKFIITGGESLPVRPGDGIPSKYPTGEVRNVPENNNSSWQSGDPIVEPQGAYRLANGKLVLSRECN